jgi:hypothetical protein
MIAVAMITVQIISVEDSTYPNILADPSIGSGFSAHALQQRAPSIT